MVDATDLPPFTFEQKQALRECRFVTAYTDGGRIVAISPDRAVADAVGVACTPFQPERWTNPERWEYELSTAHPEAVAVARELMAARAA